MTTDSNSETASPTSEEDKKSSVNEKQTDDGMLAEHVVNSASGHNWSWVPHLSTGIVERTNELDESTNEIDQSTNEIDESTNEIDQSTNELKDRWSKKAQSFLTKTDTKDLSWSTVNMTLMDKKGHVEKDILKDVWGIARAGETTAIMGSSGAGKTCLFNILAGRIRSRGNIVVSANIQLGGARIDPNKNLKMRTLFAFVAQEDALHPASTPRQALSFSAKLRLPKTTTDEEIEELVETLIHELGLELCADTVIGSSLKHGISGGEKRRTSIGIELISQPHMILLDEPISGLDSFAAKQVMKLLDKVARAGNTVLFTIHQPSSDTFRSFDRVILLHLGRLMYTGRTRDICNDFEKLGFPAPANYNPADWMLDVAQMHEVKELESHGFFPTEASDLPMEEECKEDLVIPKKSDHVSIWTEFRMLMGREKTSVIKKPAPMIIHWSLTAFLSFLFGAIFFKIGEDDQTDPVVVQAQIGALVNILICTMMSQAQPATLIFSAERPLFLREYSTSHYVVFPYFVSHLAAEALQSFAAALIQALIVYYMIAFQQTFLQFLAVTFSLGMTSTAVVVMLGSVFADPSMSAATFTLVIIPQFYFSGVFIATELIPSWIRWAQYLCSLTYASRLAYIYEFSDCGGGAAQDNCDEILKQNGANPDDVALYWLGIVGLFVLFRGLAMMVLRHKGMDFS